MVAFDYPVIFYVKKHIKIKKESHKLASFSIKNEVSWMRNIESQSNGLLCATDASITANH